MEGMAPLFIILFIVFAIGAVIWHFSRSGTILNHWAQANGYEIVSLKRCWFWRGPFFFSSKSQEVYYVTVRTADGEERRGWVCCGSWFLGMLSDQAFVKWDE